MINALVVIRCAIRCQVLLATVDGNSTDYRLHLNHLDYSIQHESIMMIYTYVRVHE